MNVHPCARTVPFSRELLVRRHLEQGWSLAESAAAAGVSSRTGFKWLARFRREGVQGFADRSCRPKRSPNATSPEVVERVIELRRLKRTGLRIARELRVAQSTVSRVLRRHRLSRARDLEPRPDVVRYERKRPGELVHIDIKKLNRFDRPGHRVHGDRTTICRGAGWDFVHVCVDDHSRLAYVEVLPNERKESATSFWLRARAWYARHGVTIERAMTDNGSCYRSGLFNKALAASDARHLYTRPYRPQTNGKAERFIQSLLREWAYAATYPSSNDRNAALAEWVRSYNELRPHHGIGAKPPISRITGEQRAD